MENTSCLSVQEIEPENKILDKCDPIKSKTSKVEAETKEEIKKESLKLEKAVEYLQVLFHILYLQRLYFSRNICFFFNLLFLQNLICPL